MTKQKTYKEHFKSYNTNENDSLDSSKGDDVQGMDFDLKVEKIEIDHENKDPETIV